MASREVDIRDFGMKPHILGMLQTPPLTEGICRENSPETLDNMDAYCKHVGRGVSAFLFLDATYNVICQQSSRPKMNTPSISD